jgi:hypothetical protein
MRREADRIWRCLDFVFEPPPNLDREKKARLILTEIRDRLGVYRDARKLRAPTGMLQRIGMMAPRTVEDFQAATPPPVFAGAGPQKSENIIGVRHRDDRPEEISNPPSLTSGSSTSSGGPPRQMSMNDDLMLDIDWVIMHLFHQILAGS